jgi:hypothetical protein
VHALARSRGLTASELLRALIERELAENSTEVAEAMAPQLTSTSAERVHPSIVRLAMEEAFPLAKTVADERDGDVGRVVRNGG